MFTIQFKISVSPFLGNPRAFIRHFNFHWSNPQTSHLPGQKSVQMSHHTCTVSAYLVLKNYPWYGNKKKYPQIPALIFWLHSGQDIKANSFHPPLPLPPPYLPTPHILCHIPLCKVNCRLPPAHTLVKCLGFTSVEY